MEEKYINGVRVFYKYNEWHCDFDDYKKARIKQNRKWSEKSFCDWCDMNDIVPVG